MEIEGKGPFSLLPSLSSVSLSISETLFCSVCLCPSSSLLKFAACHSLSLCLCRCRSFSSALLSLVAPLPPRFSISSFLCSPPPSHPPTLFSLYLRGTASLPSLLPPPPPNLPFWAHGGEGPSPKPPRPEGQGQLPGHETRAATWPSEGPALGLMLCSYHLEILNTFQIRNLPIPSIPGPTKDVAGSLRAVNFLGGTTLGLRCRDHVPALFLLLVHLTVATARTCLQPRKSLAPTRGSSFSSRRWWPDSLPFCR